MNDVALFPLNTVLFPGGRLPLRIFEQRYMDMAKACLRDGSPFGVCLIREGGEVGTPAIPAAVGTLARIGEWDMPQLGVLHVNVRGERRFRIVERRVQPDGLARADLELLPDDDDAAIPPGCTACVKLLERVLEQQANVFEPPHRLESASWVSSRLAELLPLPLPVKQELLERRDASGRIEYLSSVLKK